MKKKTVLWLCFILSIVLTGACGKTKSVSTSSTETSTEASSGAAASSTETFGTTTGSTTAPTTAPITAPTAAPLDLRGLWVLEEGTEGTFLAADIRNDGKIGVFIIVEGDDIPWAYWVGTYDAPDKDTDTYTWVSESTYKGTGLFASKDSKKRFTYEKGILKFPMTVEGQTGDIHLVRGDWDTSSIPEEVYEGTGTAAEVRSGESGNKAEKDSPYYFRDMEAAAKDYSIRITDWKVIQPGAEGNKYGSAPVIAFWYDTTNTSDKEINPTSAWLGLFTAVQDNDPNAINKLNVALHPDSKYLGNQLAIIKKDGTVTNAVAYELTDTETPVELTAKADLLGDDIGAMTFDIVSGTISNGASASIGTVDNAVKAEPSFSKGVIVAKDYTIKITDYKIIPAGQEGNKYGDAPVIAFWYETTNTSGKEIDPTSAWISIVSAVQDNDPNLVNKLKIAMLPDSRFLDSQLSKIKAGGTVENAVAYTLTDTETPVELTVQESMLGPVIGTQTYELNDSGSASRKEENTALHSDSAKQFVDDGAGLFSDEQIRTITQEIDVLRSHTGMDAAVVTITAKNGKSTQDFADEYYYNGGFGIGEGRSGFLYLIDMEEKVTHITTCGGAIDVFSDSDLDIVLDNAYVYLGKGELAESASSVISDFISFYDKAIDMGYTYDAELGRWSK